MENFDFMSLFANLELQSALIGAVVVVLVFIIGKLPAAFKTIVTKVIDGVDKELDKNKEDTTDGNS